MPIYIDYDKCTGEKLCYEICPMDVFGWDKKRNVPTLLHYDECQHCGDCQFDCPQDCIEITEPVCLW
ncbi:MAG: 4Fe-4S dicluster domain-containing protein [Thermoleophilia bacterium]